MKYNIEELLDDVQSLGTPPQESVAVPTDKELNERIKQKVLEKTGAVKHKKKTLRFGRVVAIAAAAVIFISTLSVGAMSRFKPDNALNQMIEYNSRVDYSTLGTIVNQTAEDKGLKFYLGEVLCDNNIMMIPIKCPQYNGRYVQPKTDPLNDNEIMEDHLLFYVNDKPAGSSMDGRNGGRNDNIHFDESKQDMFYLTYSGIEGIRDNTKVKLSFDALQYFDIKDDNDICDVTGNWSFEFTINRSKTRTQLDAQDFELENGEHYHIKRLVISPLGMNIDYKLTYNGKTHSMHTLFSQNIASNLSGTPMVKITMKDGTIYTDGEPDNSMETACATSHNKHDDFQTGNLESIFSSAIDVENIKTITVLDYVIYEQ